jgi:protein tyrosine/serine phosphatase
VRLVVASAFILLAGCSAHRKDSSLPSPVGVTAPEEIMAALQSSGPDSFAMVNPKLYRGGAPSADDLEYLRALGVTKIVDLRREDLGKRRAEHAEARRLGLEYVEYPFFGVFGTDLTFIDRLMAELDTGNRGAVYVHCKGGRDRTSLAVALYRVVYDGWSADLAWEREALAYGHKRNLFNRELELTFQDYAYEQTLQRQTASSSGQRVRAVSAAFEEHPNGALVHGGSDRRQAAP